MSPALITLACYQDNKDTKCSGARGLGTRSRLPFDHSFVVVRCSRFNCVMLDLRGYLRVVLTFEAINRGEMAPLSPVMHRTKQTGRLAASRRMFPVIGRCMKMV